MDKASDLPIFKYWDVEIEVKGTVLPALIFIDRDAYLERNIFLISVPSVSEKTCDMICQSIFNVFNLDRIFYFKLQGIPVKATITGVSKAVKKPDDITVGSNCINNIRIVL